MLRLFSAVNLPGCIFFGKLQQLALRKNDCDNACHSIGPISTGAEWGGGCWQCSREVSPTNGRKFQENPGW